jgi:hypothetical protein
MNINGSDLIVATHGRSFWVLDDIAPLRQAAAAQKTRRHICMRRPPRSASITTASWARPCRRKSRRPIIRLAGPSSTTTSGNAAAKVTLQILDAQSHVIRHFSSADKQPARRPLLPDRGAVVSQAAEMLATSAGEHRFVWDLAAGGSSAGTDDDADDAIGLPPGPRVAPGTYTLLLSVDDTTLNRPLRVIMDPRATATPQVLAQQFTLAESIYTQLTASRKAMAELDSVESQLKKLDSSDNPDSLRDAIHNAQAKIEKIRSGEHETADKPGEHEAGLAEATSGLGTVLRIVESGDRTAPAQALTIFDQMNKASSAGIAAWEGFKKTDLNALNATLILAGHEPLKIAAIEEQVHYAMTR